MTASLCTVSLCITEGTLTRSMTVESGSRPAQPFAFPFVTHQRLPGLSRSPQHNQHPFSRRKGLPRGSYISHSRTHNPPTHEFWNSTVACYPSAPAGLIKNRLIVRFLIRLVHGRQPCRLRGGNGRLRMPTLLGVDPQRPGASFGASLPQLFP